MTVRRRQWQPTPVLLPGKSHGQRSLVGCSPWGREEFRHDWATSLSIFTFMHWRRKWQPTPVFLPGESQRQGAWWAAIYGVTQSRTGLKRLSSSSSSSSMMTVSHLSISENVIRHFHPLEFCQKTVGVRLSCGASVFVWTSNWGLISSWKSILSHSAQASISTLLVSTFLLNGRIHILYIRVRVFNWKASGFPSPECQSALADCEFSTFFSKYRKQFSLLG